MPRLARPFKRNKANRASPSPVQQAVRAVAGWPAFAAVNLSAIGENNPLKDFRLPPLELPFLFSIGSEQDGHPNRRRLLTVSEFFKYTEQQDKDFFNALDRNGDGKVDVNDLQECLKKQNLPADYAYQFINRARGPKWWSSSISFDEFKSLIDDNESKMLRAFCVLDVDANGGLDVNKIKGSLKKLNLPDNDANAKAMLRAVGKAEDASVAYGEFRRFVILLPKEKLMSDTEPNVTWFESATCLPIGGPVEQGGGTGQLLLKAALAGGLSSGTSTLLMHPLDTLKTRVQSIPGASIRSVVRDVPTMGARAIYRGLIPAATGAFSSHGIRTCAYEACLLGLQSLGLPYMSAQPMASFVGTFVGTLVRIPCEVLKQQLQAGRHDNVRVAISEMRRLGGTRGFFRGSAALLVREVPFYVFGMVLYEQYKRVFDGEYFGGGARQLSNTECIALGALAGASASFLTTPADVLKSRLMTAAAGSTVSASQILVDLIKAEGIGALYKGALPRAVWVAPLGAMNFAGYELAKRAMGATTKPDGGGEQARSSNGPTGTPPSKPVVGPGAAPGPSKSATGQGTGTSGPGGNQGAENADQKPQAGHQPASGVRAGDAEPKAARVGSPAMPSEPLARIQWPWAQRQRDMPAVTSLEATPAAPPAAAASQPDKRATSLASGPAAGAASTAQEQVGRPLPPRQQLQLQQQQLPPPSLGPWDTASVVKGPSSADHGSDTESERPAAPLAATVTADAAGPPATADSTAAHDDSAAQPAPAEQRTPSAAAGGTPPRSTGAGPAAAAMMQARALYDAVHHTAQQGMQRLRQAGASRSGGSAREPEQVPRRAIVPGATQQRDDAVTSDLPCEHEAAAAADGATPLHNAPQADEAGALPVPPVPDEGPVAGAGTASQQPDARVEAVPGAQQDLTAQRASGRAPAGPQSGGHQRGTDASGQSGFWGVLQSRSQVAAPAVGVDEGLPAVSQEPAPTSGLLADSHVSTLAPPPADDVNRPNDADEPTLHGLASSTARTEADPSTASAAADTSTATVSDTTVSAAEPGMAQGGRGELEQQLTASECLASATLQPAECQGDAERTAAPSMPSALDNVVPDVVHSGGHTWSEDSPPVAPSDIAAPEAAASSGLQHADPSCDGQAHDVSHRGIDDATARPAKAKKYIFTWEWQWPILRRLPGIAF